MTPQTPPHNGITDNSCLILGLLTVHDSGPCVSSSITLLSRQVSIVGPLGSKRLFQNRARVLLQPSTVTSANWFFSLQPHEPVSSIFLHHHTHCVVLEPLLSTLLIYFFPYLFYRVFIPGVVPCVGHHGRRHGFQYGHRQHPPSQGHHQRPSAAGSLPGYGPFPFSMSVIMLT